MRKKVRARFLLKCGIGSIFGILIIALALWSLPFVKEFLSPERQKIFEAWAASQGIKGWFIMLGIQVLQIIIAFIPGEPVEIMAGVLYGGYGGMFLCLLGCIIASTIIFILTQKLGKPMVERILRKSILHKFRFLQDTKKLDVVIFLLFFIPGTPKDILTYIAGTTPIKPFRFLILSNFARVPAIIASTFIGFSIREGSWREMIFLFILNGGIGLLGIIYREKWICLMKHMGRKRKKNSIKK